MLKGWCCLKYWWGMGYVPKVWVENFGYLDVIQIKNIYKTAMPKFDEELLSLERKNKRAERKYRKSKTYVLKSEYENVTPMYILKILEEPRLYIENALMENCSRKKCAPLKLLLYQDVKQLPKYENMKEIANLFNKFYISKVESIIASIPNATRPKILITEFNSINSFTELSINWFRDLISLLSNSTSTLVTTPTHLVKSFPDYCFLSLLELHNLLLKANFFPQSFTMAIVMPHLKKANSENEDVSNYRPNSI